ncbi:MAG TPA: hypothetical protein VI997_06725 [Candidatus Thermoplasmatota archaeon]|nr:hypothetical protein [Candidatus Thermoplasmatota archaeon]
MTFEFVCRCGWEGTEPVLDHDASSGTGRAEDDERFVVLDAHANAWCPRCGKPADFKAAREARP